MSADKRWIQNLLTVAVVAALGVILYICAQTFI